LSRLGLVIKLFGQPDYGCPKRWSYVGLESEARADLALTPADGVAERLANVLSDRSVSGHAAGIANLRLIVSTGAEWALADFWKQL
jgi:hypothetical protein